MSVMIAMVMANGDDDVTPENIADALSKRFPDLSVEIDADQEEGKVLSLTVDGSGFFFAQMPAPIPWTDLEGPCATSILWKNATEEVKAHQVHWVVTTMADLEPLPMAALLTRATAAFMDACPSAIGVYWGNATLVIPKEVFNDFASEVLPAGPPLLIWVDFRIGSEAPQTSSGFTTGMAALGHMELEAKNCPEPPGELRERLLGLADYLLENGPIIADGNTIGEDEKERIRVVYSDSEFGTEGKVMRLEYETMSPKKPWWKLW